MRRSNNNFPFGDPFSLLAPHFAAVNQMISAQHFESEEEQLRRAMALSSEDSNYDPGSPFVEELDDECNPELMHAIAESALQHQQVDSNQPQSQSQSRSQSQVQSRLQPQPQPQPQPRQPQQVQSNSNIDDLDEQELIRRAIEESLQQSSQPQPSSSIDRPSIASSPPTTTTVDESDEEMRLAIEASLRERQPTKSDRGILKRLGISKKNDSSKNLKASKNKASSSSSTTSSSRSRSSRRKASVTEVSESEAIVISDDDDDHVHSSSSPSTSAMVIDDEDEELARAIELSEREFGNHSSAGLSNATTTTSISSNGGRSLSSSTSGTARQSTWSRIVNHKKNSPSSSSSTVTTTTTSTTPFTPSTPSYRSSSTTTTTFSTTGTPMSPLFTASPYPSPGAAPLSPFSPSLSWSPQQESLLQTLGYPPLYNETRSTSYSTQPAPETAEQRERRILREQQEREFQESLATDRERERLRLEQEEQEREEQRRILEEDQRRQRAEQQRLEERQRKIEQLTASVDATTTTAPSTATIDLALIFPDNTRRNCKFLADAPLTSVRDYVLLYLIRDLNHETSVDFDVVIPMPRKVIEFTDQRMADSDLDGSVLRVNLND